MLTLPAYSLARASIVGPMRLQGPHHSAQKSTRTGPPDFSTVSSKLLSVKVCTFSAAIVSPRPWFGLHRRGTRKLAVSSDRPIIYFDVLAGGTVPGMIHLHA